MFKRTVIPTLQNLDFLKTEYDFFFQSEGKIEKGCLIYLVEQEDLYFSPTIIFKLANEEEVANFRPLSRYGHAHLVFDSEYGVRAYSDLLYRKGKEGGLPESMYAVFNRGNYRTDFAVEMGDGLTWYLQFLHVGACGTPSDRSCQSCDMGCMQSFGDRNLKRFFEESYIEQRLKEYFNQSWIKPQ